MRQRGVDGPQFCVQRGIVDVGQRVDLLQPEFQLLNGVSGDRIGAGSALMWSGFYRSLANAMRVRRSLLEQAAQASVAEFFCPSLGRRPRSSCSVAQMSLPIPAVEAFP